MNDPIRDELDFHIAERTRELLAEGHEPAEARRLAEAAFGDRQEIEAEVERLRKSRERKMSLSTLVYSARQGLRGLLRHPGYAVLVVGTLALGLGATVAIFSVAHAVLLEPLPFADADELVTIAESDPDRAFRNPAPADFFDIRTHIAAFSSVTAFVARSGNLIGDGPPERVRYGDVAANFFETLGVLPIRGRSFGPETVGPGMRLAVIGHGLWSRRYGNDPDIIGRPLELDGATYEIVGVAPEGFDYPSGVGLWIAAQYDVPVASFFGEAAPEIRDAWFHTVVGRLAPGQSPEVAGDQLASLASRLRADYPDEFGDAEIWVEALRESEVGDLRSRLLLLMGATLLVLLIVAANVANLTLVRAIGRSREWSVRVALGAPRGGIVSLVLVESLALALIGGGIGLALAWLGIEALRPAVAPLLPVTTSLAIDATAAALALVLSVAVALLFGLFPALSVSRRTHQLRIDRGAGSRSASRKDRRAREVLVTAEIALAVVLVMGGGLLMRSLVRLQQVDLGFDPTPLTALSVGFPGSDDIAPEEQFVYYDDLSTRLGTIPGVDRIAWGQFLPADVGAGAGIRVQGRPEVDGDVSVRWHTVSHDYFATLGVEMLQGRGFGPGDRAETERVAVVNETLARRFFPDGDALGSLVNTGLDGRTDDDWNWVRIVGVAADLRNMGPARPAEPMLFRPLAQQAGGIIGGPRAVLHLRAPGAGPEIVEAVRSVVWEVNPDAPIDEVLQGRAIAGRYLAGQTLVLSLVGGFALLALLLAALGIYGITRFAVQRRTREIGVRMAIGAEQTSVVGLVVRQSLRPAFTGLALGIGVSLASSRLIGSQLPGISPLDLPTYLSVATLLATVALLATWIPARHAAGIDPVRAIRVE